MDIIRKSRHDDMHEHHILVLGIGGSGVNVLQHMQGEWTDHFQGCAIDTDHQAISTCVNVEAVHLETRVTQGMSTGGDVEAGRRAVFENRERLTALCSSADMVFIVAGFGGGTGTGGAAALAEIASDTGALVLGFIMLPFEFEGSERTELARSGLVAFQDVADGVVVIHNQRLLTISAENPVLTEAFDLVSRSVTGSIKAMWRLITTPGLINLDFADFRRMVMDSHGLCTLVTEQCQGDDRTERLVETVLDHGLFDCRRVLEESRAVIVGICGGDDLTLIQVQKIMESLKDVVGDGTRIVMGTSLNPHYRGKIGLTVLASEGFVHEEQDSGADVADETATGRDKADKPTRKRGRKNRPVQSQLNLDAPGKGRFKDVEPTLRNGEDLDVPTFIRRGTKLHPQVDS